jgi:hypothetical protein
MKPPTYQELEQLLPWAHVELSDEDNELVIYTGLAFDEDNEPDGLIWVEDMDEFMEDD